MIRREKAVDRLLDLLGDYPVVAIVGARQVGKTTLARNLVSNWRKPAKVFDLEDPGDAARLADPMLALRDLEGLVVIDEIQRQPAIFEVLRVLADRPANHAQFLVLGSASPAVIQRGSESLAGRIAYHELEGFSLEEVGPGHDHLLWIRGGFPRSYCAATAGKSMEWRRMFVQTFLERDLARLGIGVSPETMRRFWNMLAHYHGQVWNASEFARAFGVADTTVRGYLDHLASALVVDILLPWHENISKRQVKAPKVYVADSGILHTLLNLPAYDDIASHPKVGASWEGFALGQVRRFIGARRDECFFWATYAGAELDLVVIHGKRRIGFEFKRTVAPRLTPSMRHALADLRLERLDVVHAGDDTFPLADRIRAVALPRLLRDVEPLG